MSNDRTDESNWYSSGGYDAVATSAQSGITARIFHSQIERGIPASAHYPRVLEVGALTGQHLPYVRHSFDSWVLSDIVPHPTGVFDDARISFVQQDVHKMTFEDHFFDRVAATCVVHHLDRPMTALAEMRRVCKPGGAITILLPIDPGWMYDLSLRLTSVRRAKKLGLLDEALRSRALDHHNHFTSLRWQFGEAFRNDDVKVFTWPLPFGGKFLNIFSAWHIVRGAK